MGAVYGGDPGIRTPCSESTDLQSAAVANAARSPYKFTALS